MMTSVELSRFEQSLRDTLVLTVYLDLQGIDTAAAGAARRREIEARVTGVQESLGAASAAGLAAFHGCVARLEVALDAAFAARGSRGWAGFFPADGEPRVEALPVQMPSLVAWQPGPRIAPYVRALKQHVPAVVAVLDGPAATIYRYARGVTERVAVPESSSPGDDGRQAALERDVTHALVASVDGLARPDAWIFIGGDHAAAMHTIAALPDEMQARAHWLRGVGASATESEVRDAAEHMATAASRVRDLELVLDVFDRVASGGAGVAGLAATRAALLAGEVDTLFFTGQFVRECAEPVEELVRLALDHGAGLEYVSAAAAERLDHGGGVGALLRRVPARTPAVPSRSHAITPGPR